jgi:hypothetical protein
MDILLGWRTEKLDLPDGSVFKYEAKPLSREAMLKLTPFISAREETDIKVLSIEGYKLQETAAKVLPDHARNFVGLNIDGAPVTIEQLTNESALVNITGNILAQLVNLSSLKVSDAEKSEGPSDDQNSGISPGTE